MSQICRLIADSGSTKATWCLTGAGRPKRVRTQGISPYFLSAEEISALIRAELLPALGKKAPGIEEVHFYGTGCADPRNARMIARVLKGLFPAATVRVNHDLMGAARALCGHSKGLACILGTGSSSCYYNGRRIAHNSPGLGFILGDEGSGAWMGRSVIQYYLYGTFDGDLHAAFEAKYHTSKAEILEQVYKGPFPNRYLASFARFLSENRGHYMIENIIEDSLNEFFFRHICKYAESWKYPVHFTGGIANSFSDVVMNLCHAYELTPGSILREPMDGLVRYHHHEA